MKLKIEKSNVYLSPESSYDELLLSQPSVSQKISFEQKNNLDSAHIINTDKFIEKDTNLGLGLYQLRVFMNYHLAAVNVLSMHAGAINTHDKTIIVSGGSKCGKSSVLDELASFGEVIGDDHIIISNNYISGNKTRRIRNKGLYSNQNKQELKENISFYLLEPSKENYSENIKFFDEHHVKNILKYSQNSIQRPNRTYLISDIVGSEISNMSSLLYTFLNKGICTKNIRGTLDFVISEIENERLEK